MFCSLGFILVFFLGFHDLSVRFVYFSISSNLWSSFTSEMDLAVDLLTTKIFLRILILEFNIVKVIDAALLHSVIYSGLFILFFLNSYSLSFIRASISLEISFISDGKSHLESYPSPLNINYFWNFGFLLFIFLFIQIFSGFMLSSFYESCNAYISVVHILREVTFGFIYRYIHSNGASFIFGVSFIHIARAILFGSLFYIPLSWFTGIFIFILLIIIGFMGYVLPWGQMSFWGATVITNLLSFIPLLIEWVCGSYFISEPTLKRFFIFHFILPLFLFYILFYHIFYLHYQSSDNPLGFYILSIPLFPYLFSKDFFGFMITGFFLNFCILPLSHPDNGLTVNGVITPLHILPEWYFLIFYAILKAIPNKNSGFIILFYYILYSLCVECINVTYSINNLLFLSSSIIILYFYSYFYLIYIGYLKPLDLFIFYGRIFTIIIFIISLVLLDYKLQ